MQQGSASSIIFSAQRTIGDSGNLPPVFAVSKLALVDQLNTVVVEVAGKSRLQFTKLPVKFVELRSFVCCSNINVIKRKALQIYSIKV